MLAIIISVTYADTQKIQKRYIALIEGEDGPREYGSSLIRLSPNWLEFEENK
jgi:hypothetical protein